MRAWSPRAAALGAERRRQPPGYAQGDAFGGFGILGVYFEKGDVLVFRRTTASSKGPPFSSIWHRSPEGEWAFIVDVEPARSCPHYFGHAGTRVVRCAIRHRWRSDHELVIDAPAAGYSLCLRLQQTPATRILSVACLAIPAFLFSSPATAGTAGWLAGRLLGTRPLVLQGTAPNGHRFAIRPRGIWHVTATAALLQGRDPGPFRRLKQRVALGGFVLPERPLMVLADSFFVPPPAAEKLVQPP
jgi:hypothetical protein